MGDLRTLEKNIHSVEGFRVFRTIIINELRTVFKTLGLPKFSSLFSGFEDGSL
jgi:hypothetical protein